ncbi:2-keto-4-pentenoate hydratase [Rhodocaloribacter sp.]
MRAPRPKPEGLRLPVAAVLCAALLFGCAGKPDPNVRRMAADYAAMRLFPPLADTLTMEDAMAIQASFVSALEPRFGPPVGYKAGLTSAAAQARFGADRPVRGVLLREMLRPSGAVVPTLFGARPLFEGDLLVRVGSEAVNRARTDDELLAALDAVLPFLELPDLMYDPAMTLDAPALAAVNVGARLGIVGEVIPLAALGDAYDRLGRFRVALLDTTGAVLAEGDGAALLGHPLNVVRWLRDSLARDGVALRPGDLLSLGSLTPLMPVRPGQTITARYTGLASEPVEVTVTFR